MPIEDSPQACIHSALPRLYNSTLKCPIQKCIFFVLDKAAQGFAVRRTQCTPQPETRGERRTAQKRPFMQGHYIATHLVGASVSIIKRFLFWHLLLISGYMPALPDWFFAVLDIGQSFLLLLRKQVSAPLFSL